MNFNAKKFLPNLLMLYIKKAEQQELDRIEHIWDEFYAYQYLKKQVGHDFSKKNKKKTTKKNKQRKEFVD